MYDTAEEQEKIVLIAINTDKPYINLKNNLAELLELVKTAGGSVVGTMIQARSKPENLHYFGKGKVEELKDYIALTNATGIVCDDELTGRQLSNLETMLDTKVMDRTMVILAIFAKHATTTEGKLQVELAQLKYNSSRLIGIEKNLARQDGGGIGSRGPGETKLETDRRFIKDKILSVDRELTLLAAQRKVMREKRERNGIPVISMVGYTNAGKSTLLNAVSDANVLAENKLFATLDTTTRQISLPNDSKVLFSDTVGFINKLPHHLIKAFRATLEELFFADILVHVIDSSSHKIEEEMDVVYKTLSSLNCDNKPIITVFNKIDIIHHLPLPKDENAKKIIEISALKKIGLDSFLEVMETVLKSFRKELHVIIPYSNGKLVNMVHTTCEIVKEECRDNGTYMHLFAPQKMYNNLEPYSTLRVL